MRYFIPLGLSILLLTTMSVSGQQNGQGIYFQKNSATLKKIPEWASTKELLPAPVFDENKLLVETYWKAWELAFTHFNMPAEGTGFVSPFIDAAFNANIFEWDTGFMTMFCNYGYPLVPGIGSLDNFYARQHPDGEICREIVRKTGKDYGPWTNTEKKSLFTRGGYSIPEGQPQGKEIVYIKRPAPTPSPLLTLDGLDHPIMAWAEWESYLLTGEKERLYRVWLPLVKYHEALDKYIRQGNGLYMTDWASMDNSPRNPMLKSGGMGIDISAEMVLFDLNMASMGDVIGKSAEAAAFRKKAAALSSLISKKMWNEKRHFYTDMKNSEELSDVRTVAAYWTMLAKIASPEQAKLLVAELKNPNTFGTANPVPTLAADEPGYALTGNYWCGSVWAPTNTMVLRGLENYGYNAEAYEIAMKHLALVADVYKKTGTVWENYMPDSASFGLHEDGTKVEHDFVGWSGIGPIMYLLEYAIGIKASAPANEIKWTIRSAQPSGCKNFRFNHHVVSLLASPGSGTNGKLKIDIISDGGFTLRVSQLNKQAIYKIEKGQNHFEL